MGPTIGNSATIDDKFLGFQGNMVGIYHPQSVLMNWVCRMNLDDVTCPPNDGWLLGWFLALCLPMLATVLVIFRGQTHGKKGVPQCEKNIRMVVGKTVPFFDRQQGCAVQLLIS